MLHALLALALLTSCTKGVPELESLGLELPGPTLFGVSQIQIGDEDETVVLQGEYDSRFSELWIEAPLLAQAQTFSISAVSLAAEDNPVKQFRIERNINEWIDFENKPPGTTDKIKIYGVTKIGKSLPTEITFVFNPTGPSATIATHPPADTNITTGTFTFTGSAQTVSFTCSVDGAAYAPCVSPFVTAALGDGPHTFDVKGVDSDANESSATSFPWNIDTNAPVISIASPTAASTHPVSITFTGSCETGIPIAVTGDVASAPIAETCTASAFSFTATLTGPDGLRNVTVAQTDNATNTASDSVTVTLDDTDPALTITGPMVNTQDQTGLSMSGACETGLTITIAGDVTAPANFACPGVAYAVPVPFSAGEGPKNITASQTDAVGNVTTVSRVFIRDNTAPSISMTANPLNPTAIQAATFSFNATDANGVTGYQCQLDGGGFGACTSPKTYAGPLSDGAHTFDVRASDMAINISAIASYGWAVDTSAPTIAFTGPPAGLFAGATATLTGTCETGLTVSFTGDVTGSPTDPCVATPFSKLVTFTLGDGAKNVTITQNDGAGNIGSDIRSFTVDTIDPTVTITGQPLLLTGLNGATFTFNGSDANGISGYQCRLDGGGFGACTSPKSYAGLSSAPHIFEVYATDNVGRNSVTQSYTWTVDTVFPGLTSTAPLGGTYSPVVLFTGACEDGLPINVIGDAFGAPYPETCSASGYSFNVTLNGPDGLRTVTLQQTDGAGNVTNIPVTVTRDGTGPTVAITSPPVGQAASVGTAISGTCEIGGSVVTISGDVVGTSFACDGAGNFFGGVSCTAGECAKNVVATQTDVYGNPGNIGRGFIRDDTAPVLSLISQPNNPTNSLAATFDFNATDANGIQGYACEIDGGGFGACTAPKTYVGPLGQGSHTVLIRATDNAGLTSNTITHTWTVDSLSPTVAFTAPAPGAYLGASTSIQGNCETGLTATASGDISGTPTDPCAAGTFNIAINFSAGEGSKNVTVTQTDGAGNSSAPMRSFFKDTINPGISITAGPSGTVSSVTAIFTFSGTDASPIVGYECDLDGGGFAPCSSGDSFPVGDGAHNIDIKAEDAAGLFSAPASRAWTVDSNPPSAFTIAGYTGGTDVTLDSYLVHLNPVVNWTDPGDAANYDVVVKDAAGSAIVCAQQTTSLTNLNFSGCPLTDNTSYRAYV
ncbi:MAG: hypothetical protein ABL958_01720, partial [Bdellovibrionia bacterium]